MTKFSAKSEPWFQSAAVQVKEQHYWNVVGLGFCPPTDLNWNNEQLVAAQTHGYSYILNTLTRSLGQSLVAVQMETAPVCGRTLSKMAGKRMKSYWAVLFDSAVLCVYNILVTLLMLLMCKGDRWLPPGYILWHITCLFFKSDDLLYVWQGTNNWGVWLSLRNCCYFLSCMLSTSFHFTVHKCHLPWPTWLTSACLNCETPVLSAFSPFWW